MVKFVGSYSGPALFLTYFLGHLQFIAAAPDRGDFIWQSYFGYAPELLDNKKLKQKLKRADFYFLGVFLLQVALGKDLVPSKDQLARVSVPDHLPTTLRSLLFSVRRH
jgi:hypothetical protein